MDSVPAMVVGRRSDILAWNRIAAAVFGDWAELPVQERNWARLVFLRPEYRDLIVDWKLKAIDTVSQLRMDAGTHPNDPLLSALVGELSVKNEEFRQLWATHNVKERPHGTQRLRHPLVGELDLRIESFLLADDHEQALLTYHAEPGSPSAEGLRLLASWEHGRDTGRNGHVTQVGLVRWMGPAVRARSARYARSASSSRSARARASRMLSETPVRARGTTTMASGYSVGPTAIAG